MATSLKSHSSVNKRSSSTSSILESGSYYEDHLSKHSSICEGEVLDGDEDNDFHDDIYDVVDSIVPRSDDPTMHSLTFRVLVLGTLMGVVFSALNTVFTFRTNPFMVNPFIAILGAYPLAWLMEKALPTTVFRVGGFEFTVNPGPFNFKEHALICVFVTTGSNISYALNNIISQKYFLQQNISTGWCIIFAITTQCFGYGLAGLTRKLLVRPITMLWPANLSIIGLLNSMHSVEAPSVYKLSRLQMFWLSAAAMFAYQWLPGFFTPLLGAVSLLCYVAPNNNKIKLFGSAANGVGALSLTFDWAIISGAAPITTPLWALINQVLGAWFLLWFLIPVLWSTNAFGMDSRLGTNPAQGPNGTGQFPLGYALNTPALFDKNGVAFPATLLIDPATKQTLNTEFYESVKPVQITTLFAVEYMCSFLTFAASITHVFLWYGADIWHRIKVASKDLDREDMHCQLMDVYPEVPDYWYFAILVVNIALTIACCTVGGFTLPWWAIFLALAIACVAIVPMGVIAAISGQTFGINILSELIIAFILPGQYVSVLTFKTLTYMAAFQGIFMVQDLKLGHYLKIAPRNMFIVQLYSTIIGAVVNVITALYVFDHLGDKIMNHLEGWNAAQYQIFYSAGAIWGAIGPAQFFGPSSRYFPVLLGFVIGAVAPLIPWLLSKWYPHSFWHLVNVPLLVKFPSAASSFHSDMISPLLVGGLFNYFFKKYRHGWWSKYAYVMSAAFDTGCAVALTIIFFGIIMPTGFGFKTFHAFNHLDVENCVPWYMNKCYENMISGGASYNVSNDLDICQMLGILAQNLTM